MKPKFPTVVRGSSHIAAASSRRQWSYYNSIYFDIDASNNPFTCSVLCDNLELGRRGKLSGNRCVILGSCTNGKPNPSKC